MKIKIELHNKGNNIGKVLTSSGAVRFTSGVGFIDIAEEKLEAFTKEVSALGSVIKFETEEEATKEQADNAAQNAPNDIGTGNVGSNAEPTRTPAPVNLQAFVK